MREQKRKDYRNNLFKGKRKSSDYQRHNGTYNRDGGKVSKMLGLSKDKEVVKRLNNIVVRVSTKDLEES